MYTLSVPDPHTPTRQEKQALPSIFHDIVFVLILVGGLAAVVAGTTWYLITYHELALFGLLTDKSVTAIKQMHPWISSDHDDL